MNWWVDKNKRLFYQGEPFADLAHVPDFVTGYRGVCCYRWGEYLICFDRDGPLFEEQNAKAQALHMSLDSRFLAVVEAADSIAIYTLYDGFCQYRYPIQEAVAELRFLLGWKLFVRYQSGDFVVLQLEGIS